MNILEKDLEDLIWDKIEQGDFLALREKGLIVRENAKFWRQYNFSSYGIADIISLMIVKTPDNWVFYVDIFELKKELVNSDTLKQAARYAKGVERMVDNWNYRHAKNRKIILNTNMHLIGKKVNGGGFLYLTDVFSNLYLYQYGFDFDEGITFNRMSDYHLSEELIFNNPDLRGAIYNYD